MKQMILAAVALLGLGFGTAFAQSYSHEMPPSAQHQPLQGN